MNYLYQQLLQREQSQSRNALYDRSGDLWMSYGQEDEHKDRHKHQPTSFKPATSMAKSCHGFALVMSSTSTTAEPEFSL